MTADINQHQQSACIYTHMHIYTPGMIIGFTLGVIVMLSMSVFMDEEEPDAAASVDHECDGAHDDHESGAAGEMTSLMAQENTEADARHRRHGANKSSTPSCGSSVDSHGSEKHSRSGHHSMVGEAYRIAANGSQRLDSPDGRLRERVPPFPADFALAVYIDSMLDGLLVGLTLITGKSAGLYMAVAMAFEMGFLGLTFAAACSRQVSMSGAYIHIHTCVYVCMYNAYESGLSLFVTT
jgi:zinc transporter ZupT